MDISGSKVDKVYLGLRSYIDENKFASNLRIPSENVLTRRYDVSRDTVRAALSRLSEEGLITKIKGSGTYINRDEAITRELGGDGSMTRIGLILQGQDPDANAALIKGIRSILPPEQVDFHVFLTDNKFANERRCLQTVVHQAFNGFIVDGVKASLLNPNLDCYQQIYKKRIPVIFYNNYYKELRYPRVTINDRQCADQLLTMLIRAGHRHIAGIFNFDNYQSIEKFQGMVAVMKRHKVEFRDDYIKWCISNEAHDERFTRVIEKFLNSLPGCTAVVCCNYMIYRMVRNVIEKQGKRVPDDYSLVCFDYSKDDWKEEGITCSVHQGYEIGRQVASRLMLMIDRRECYGDSYSCTVPPEIYVGNTVGNIGKLR